MPERDADHVRDGHRYEVPAIAMVTPDAPKPPLAHNIEASGPWQQTLLRCVLLGLPAVRTWHRVVRRVSPPLAHGGGLGSATVSCVIAKPGRLMRDATFLLHPILTGPSGPACKKYIMLHSP